MNCYSHQMGDILLSTCVDILLNSFFDIPKCTCTSGLQGDSIMISINHFKISIIYFKTSYKKSRISINRIMNILKLSIFLDILKSNLIRTSKNQIMDIRNSA